VLATVLWSPAHGRTKSGMKPFYTFGEYNMGPAARRPARHPIITQSEKTKLSKSELVELARKRLRMLVELNTEVEEELVALVTEEHVDMGQFVNIDFDPNHMFQESEGVSHDGGVVVVDFASV